LGEAFEERDQTSYEEADGTDYVEDLVFHEGDSF
jgi:hypothetical protein